jgi:hypothetical protein
LKEIVETLLTDLGISALPINTLYQYCDLNMRENRTTSIDLIYLLIMARVRWVCEHYDRRRNDKRYVRSGLGPYHNRSLLLNEYLQEELH